MKTCIDELTSQYLTKSSNLKVNISGNRQNSARKTLFYVGGLNFQNRHVHSKSLIIND